MANKKAKAQREIGQTNFKLEFQMDVTPLNKTKRDD
jgi:hypothetical protein